MIFNLLSSWQCNRDKACKPSNLRTMSVLGYQEERWQHPCLHGAEPVVCQTVVWNQQKNINLVSFLLSACIYDVWRWKPARNVVIWHLVADRMSLLMYWQNRYRYYICDHWNFILFVTNINITQKLNTSQKKTKKKKTQAHWRQINSQRLKNN